jgi:hypothetical protein
VQPPSASMTPTSRFVQSTGSVTVQATVAVRLRVDLQARHQQAASHACSKACSMARAAHSILRQQLLHEPTSNKQPSVAPEAHAAGRCARACCSVTVRAAAGDQGTCLAGTSNVPCATSPLCSQSTCNQPGLCCVLLRCKLLGPVLRQPC